MRGTRYREHESTLMPDQIQPGNQVHTQRSKMSINVTTVLSVECHTLWLTTKFLWSQLSWQDRARLMDFVYGKRPSGNLAATRQLLSHRIWDKTPTHQERCVWTSLVFQQGTRYRKCELQVQQLPTKHSTLSFKASFELDPRARQELGRTCAPTSGQNYQDLSPCRGQLISLGLEHPSLAWG